MSISAVGAAPPHVHLPLRGEGAEGAGPDHDGDSDDTRTAPPAVRAPQPPSNESSGISLYL